MKFLISFFSFFLIYCLSAEEQVFWPERHGPSRNGLVADADFKNLATEWGENKNLSWKLELKGKGHSTPVIMGNYVWFTSATLDGKEMYVYCIDRHSGKVVHHKLIFQNANPEPLGLGEKDNSYATPSCIAEPGAVYVHFGTYGTARLDSKSAKIVWSRRDINVRHNVGPASSPTLYKNAIILTMDGLDKQFLTALDKKTGKTIWITKRSVDFKDLVDGVPKREGGHRKAFGMAAFAEVNGKTQILSVGAKAAYGYDADTGKDLWILTHNTFNAAVTPIYIPEHKMAIINTGSAKATLYGIDLSEKVKGKINGSSNIKWSQRRASRYSMPVYYKDHIYQITQDGYLSCIDVKTGETKWKESLVRSFIASPILAGNKFYIIGKFGKTTVFEANPENFIKVADNEIDGEVTASLAVAEGALFIRSKTHLYKISK